MMRAAPVLIVASDPRWRTAVADRLLLQEHVVLCATSTAEAASFVEAGVDPAVMVVDARVEEVVQDYRRAQTRDPHLCSIPVVAIADAPRGAAGSPQGALWIFVRTGELESAVERMAELSGHARP
jgi:hypothetical protein